ncbi:MAG: hypothetical protein LBK68_07380 [Candidatus Margulisbacteria bacterium]|jgi:hypothetical protein|nr:hypothetical protein [Candidatus Margulisiibacteriota bacterium]
MKSWLTIFCENLKKTSALLSSWIAAFLVFFIISLIVCLFLKPSIETIYNQNFTIIESNESNLTEQDLLDINKLISKHKIVPVSTIYDNTLSYYNSLITILVTLLGLFAFVSWFHIRNNVKSDIEESLRETINNGNFNEIVDCKIESKLQKYMKDNLADYANEAWELLAENIKESVSKEYELQSDKIKEDILKILNEQLKPKDEQAGIIINQEVEK